MTLWPIEAGRGIAVPSVARTAVIPQIDSRPAFGTRPSFDPFDPLDIDVFQFDWSPVAIPGDSIIEAFITASPATITISSPLVFGLIVQVFMGPGVAATYAVICQAVFSSGRVLDWACELPVRAL